VLAAGELIERRAFKSGGTDGCRRQEIVERLDELLPRRLVSRGVLRLSSGTNRAPGMNPAIDRPCSNGISESPREWSPSVGQRTFGTISRTSTR
jgi:hypothetical protein